MFFVSICTDMNALRESGLVADDSPYRGVIDGRSGAHVCYSADGSQSMIAITSIDGLENLQDLPYVLVHTPEEIFGYRRQVEVDGVLQFGEPTVTVTPAYTPSVVIGYEDDLTRPIYRVERVETPTIRTFTDEDGNTVELPGRPIVEYVTTDEIEGYHQKPIYGPEQEWVQVLEPTGEVDEFDNPIMVDNGYWQDVVVPESPYETPNPIMEEVAGDAELKALYDLIYDQTPVTDEEGNVHTPPKLFAVPGGAATEHLL